MANGDDCCELPLRVLNIEIIVKLTTSCYRRHVIIYVEFTHIFLSK